MKQYYLVGIENSTRISNKCETPEQAMKYCYGVVLRDGVAIPFGGRAWKYLSNKKKTEIQRQFDEELKRKQ